jgi:ethanolamine utilization protein EutQ (cupin superfamily)
VTPLDLQCSVLDTKLVVQVLAERSEEFVLINQTGLDQVRGQSRFGSTHSPNMEVMHFPHPGEGAEISLDCLWDYSPGYRGFR